MAVPTKPFGKPGGALGVMMGAGATKSTPPSTSDGLMAMQARLAGAKKMKAMKVPTKKGRQKQDLSSSGSVPSKPTGGQVR